MADPITITVILSAIVTSAIYDSLKIGMKYLLVGHDSPVVQAIKATCALTPDVDGTRLEVALRDWCVSEQFRDVLDEFHRGNSIEIRDDDIVQGFIIATDLYFLSDAEQLERCAEILLTFTQRLHSAIYNSPEGISALAARLEGLYREGSTRDEERHAETREVLLRIERQLPSAVAIDMLGSGEQGAGVDNELLRIAKELIEKGQLKAAESLLVDGRNRFNDATTSDVHFRMAALLGDCLLKSGRVEDAIAEFQTAVRIVPTHAKVPKYKALIALLRDDPESVELAREAFLASVDNDSSAANIYILALDTFAGAVDALAILDDHSWIANHPECAYLLGTVYQRRSRFAESEVAFRDALADDTSNPHVLLGLGTTIIEMVHAEFDVERRLKITQPAHLVTRLLEAEAYLSTAVVGFRERGDSEHLVIALVNRAAARAFRKEYTGALDDCRAALEVNPRERVALITAGQISLLEQQYERTCDYLEGIGSVGDAPEAATCLAEAYHHLERHDKVIALLLPIWQQHKPSRHLVTVADQLLTAYWSLGELQQIEVILGVLDEVLSNEADARYVRSNQWMREERWEDAIRELRIAIALGASTYATALKLDLAEVLYRTGEFAEAANLYEQIDDGISSTFIASRRLLSLYQAERFATAHSVARQMKQRNELRLLATDVEAEIEELFGNLNNALILRHELLSLDAKPRRHVALAHVLFRMGRTDESRGALEHITIESLLDDADALIAAGRLRLMLGMPQSILFGYYARRVGFRRPDIHQNFMALMVAARNRTTDESNVVVVSPDTVVTFQRHDVAVTVALEGRIAEADLQQHEVATSATLADDMMGLCIGDAFTWKAGTIAETRCVITTIEYKPVVALRETLAQFALWFPDNSAVTEFRIDPSDSESLQQVVEVTTAHRRFTEQFEAAYRNGRLPLQTFAKLIGESICTVWFANIGGSGLPLFISSDSRELGREIANSRDATSVTLDITSLLTLAKLDLVHTVADFYENVYIAQAVFDRIRYEHESTYTTYVERSRMHSYAGQIFLTKELREDWEFEKGLMERVRSFVENTATVKGIPPTDAAEADANLADAEEQLGVELARSAILARTDGAVLICDDMLGRRLACDFAGCTSGSTLALVLALAEKSVISGDDVNRCQVLMCDMGYEFIPVSAATVMWAAGQVGYQLSQSLARVIATLRAPLTTDESALEVATDIARALWTEWPASTTRPLVFDLVLGALMTGRRPALILERFRQRLREKMALLHVERAEIEQSIDLWMRFHRLGRS